MTQFFRFKQKGAVENVSTKSLKNFETLISAYAQKNPKSFNDLTTDKLKATIQEIILESTRQFGYQQTRHNFRLLGNAVRICSQSQNLKDFFFEFNLGLDANALHASGSGEKGCLRAVCHYLQKTNKKLTCFDIGANRGDWSEMLIKEMHRSFTLHIFEPNSSLIVSLEEKISRMMKNATSDSQSIINNCGIGADGQSTLFISNRSDEMASTNPVVGKFYENSSKANIRLVNGCDYLKQHSIVDIDLLKIDTEGTEFDVLNTFNKSISGKCIKFVQFEYGVPTYYTGKGLKDFFQLLGQNYTIHRIYPEGISDALFYNQDAENFKWANYLALRRDQSDFFEYFEAI